MYFVKGLTAICNFIFKLFKYFFIGLYTTITIIPKYIIVLIK